MPRFHRHLRAVLAAAVLLGAGATVLLGAAAPLRLDAVTPAAARPHRATAGLTFARPVIVAPGRWLAGWAASPQAPVPGTRSALGFRDQTIRQIVYTSIGGSIVRVRLTNASGTRPLTIDGVSIAIQRRGAALSPGTIRPLTFAGRPAALIAPGADVLSDPVRLPLAALDHVAVSLFVPGPTGPATQHLQAREVTYLAAGSRVLDAGAGPFTAQTTSWYFLAGLDVRAPSSARGTVVALGDSITDGVGSEVNANARWPNLLARRLADGPASGLSVVDEGIGGNRVLSDAGCCGIGAVARFHRDVLRQPAVRDVILLEGINDIGSSTSRDPRTAPHTDVSALQIVEGYERMIARAHAAGVRIFGGTLTPFAGARYWTPAGEAKREAVNRWILSSGAFDGVIDFAAAVADPRDPERLAPADDSGDHLHPDDAGYRAMAGAIELGMLLGSDRRAAH
jgi:lysophospholipase L1-like esterase